MLEWWRSKSAPTRGVLAALAIVSLALCVRVVYLLQIRATPFFEHPYCDAQMYDNRAMEILGGEILGSRALYQAPLYAYFLAFLYRVLGHDYLLVRIAQAALGALNCGLVYALGRAAFGERVGRIAGTIAAVYGTLVFFDAELLRSTLVIALSLGALLALCAACSRPALRRWAVAGLLLGLAAITQESILLFVPLALLWSWAQLRARERLPRIAGHLVVLGLAVGAVLLPVSVRNYLVTGDRLLVSFQGGLNFYIGNNPDADRTTTLQPGTAWDDLVTLPDRTAGITLPSQHSRWFYAEALKFIRERPFEWLGLLGKKFVLFWNAAEVDPNNDLPFYRTFSPLFAVLFRPQGLLLVPFGLVGPLALLGMSLTARAPGRPRLLLLFVVATMAAVVLFHVRARYRLPAVPVLIIFAALALDRMAAGCRGAWSGREKAACAVALAALTVFVNADFWSVRSAPRLPLHATLGKHLLEEGRLEEAQVELLKAIESDPADYEADLNLGFIRERQGRGDEALVLFREALRAKPDSALAYNNIGVWYFSRGQLEPAIEALERAVALRAWDPRANYNLGVAYLRRRQFDRAAAAFGASARLEPENAAARSAYEEALRLSRDK